VLLASPAMPSPFQKATELTLTGPDEARISQAGAFASYGEPARLMRGADGAVAEVLIAGGRSIPEAALAAELLGRYAR
jgi:D-alanyl-D-alanine carboxypeptidase